MSQVCQISGTRRNKANQVSFSNKHHRKFQQPNLQSKRFWDPDGKRWIRLKVTTKVIKTITKCGLKKPCATTAQAKNWLSINPIVLSLNIPQERFEKYPE